MAGNESRVRDKRMAKGKEFLNATFTRQCNCVSMYLNLLITYLRWYLAGQVEIDTATKRHRAVQYRHSLSRSLHLTLHDSVIYLHCINRQ